MGSKAYKKQRPKGKEKRYKEPSGLKSPRSSSGRPIFSFHHMRYGSKHCLSKCQVDMKASIADTLVRLSQLTWGKIASEPKDGLGWEPIPHFRFKVPLPPVVTPEVTILVFRHSGASRIAGFREDDVYHIVLVGDDLYSH